MPDGHTEKPKAIPTPTIFKVGVITINLGCINKGFFDYDGYYLVALLTECEYDNHTNILFPDHPPEII